MTKATLFDPPARKRVHAHSGKAYREGAAAFSAREKRIMDFLREHGPATDLEVCAGLGFHDCNCVRPRITELVQEGQLVEVGSERDACTGKVVRMVSLR